MRRKRNPSAGNREDSKRRKNERDAEDKRALRSMNLNRQKEQEKDTKRRQMLREDEIWQSVEQQRNTETRRHAREDKERRDAEQERNTERRRHAREDEERRDAEQERDTERRRNAREDKERRNTEQGINTLRRREVRNNKVTSYDQALTAFRKRNREGPTNVCLSCGSLYFRKSVTTRTRERLLKAGCTDDFLQKVIILKPTADGTIILCSTCCGNIEQAKVPRRCLSNGLAFPERPAELTGMSLVEEILASPRCAFMQIRQLGWDGQYGLKGNIVNVPIDVNETEKVLPRKISNSSVIHLALMRKMEYKHPYLYETIRPKKVYEACKYLVATPVYKEQGITLSEEWKDIDSPIYFQETANLPLQQTTDVEDSDAMEIDPNSSEDEDENNSSTSSYPEQTMLIDDTEFLTHAIKHAPGEGNRPISLLWDLNAEVLTFPTIYCGQQRKINPGLTYSDIAKSEALNADRRSCAPNKLLFMFKKSQLQQVVDSITISLRKRPKMQDVTAGNLLDPDYVTGLEHRNEGYKILKNIRSSPAYWEARIKELFATLRQLGMPAVFHTVSAMEIQWPELLVILKQILDGIVITEGEAEALPQQDKNNLIRRDPITCARYFDAKTQDYFNIILKSKAVFLDHPLQDYFWRVEFQHRGSPHLHIFLWLKGAPVYSPDDPFYCVKFIDQYITTAKTELSVRFQHHRHTHCCRRQINGVMVCRFGIPYPPMDRTQILTPLAQEFPEGDRVLLKNELSKIKARLKEFESQHLPNISYAKFLEDIKMTEEKYILAIRSNIRRPTVFLKREVESAYINAYNEKLLTAWRSNMDLQYVIDPYACAKYLSQYISKSYRGMSTLLRKTMTELQRGNQAVKTQLKTIGSVFVNKSEVSAQEAAYGILGLPLSKFSRDHVYLNTGVTEDRSRLTKSKDELMKMDPADTNVIVDGLLEHYVNRSNDLENLCFADYAAWYNFKNSKDLHVKNKSGSTPGSAPIFIQKDGNGYVKRRQFAKVIRSRRYGEHREPFMYHREQVMLYHPWRDEVTELNTDPFTKYVTHKEAINAKAKEYNKLSKDYNIDELCQEYEAEDENNEATEIDEENNGVGSTDQNIFDDKKSAASHSFLLPGILPQAEYADLMDSLNLKQKNYLLHVIHAIKSQKQILEYLGGGAGVGKSTTVRAIVQALTRYFLTQPGARPDLLRVLLCAPTGIAAYNIEGKTIHSAFILPYNQSRKQGNRLRTLDPDTRTRISSKLINVKLVICDEVSMVSSGQLGFINERLKEYFHSDQPFGGHSLIFVGDLWQLPPIGGSAIFTPIKNDISSLAGTTLWEKFRFYELDQIMRQQGDPAFAQALNRMKVGLMTEDDIKMLKSREISAFNQPPANVVWLFHHRIKVHEFNELALAKCTESGITAIATDKIEGKGEIDETGRIKLLDEARKLDYQDAEGLPYELILKKTIKYMVTSNVHTDLANGAIGILRHVTTKNVSGDLVPTTVWLEFPETGTGRLAREAYTGFRSPAINSKWTPVVLQTKQVKIWEGKQVRVVRTQFPLTPAEAITIYKSQSQSFTQMVLTPHPGITRSLLYVGCSRAKSSSGLWINGTFVAPKPVSPTNSVFQAYEELRKRPVLLSHLPSPAPRKGMISIVFYNIQHYVPHKKELENILSTTNPNIITLVETHTYGNQNVDCDEYKIVQRSDKSEENDSGYGTMCFSTLDMKEAKSMMIKHNTNHVEVHVLNFTTFAIVYGYASPKASFSDLQNAIETVFNENQLSATTTILMGDFNMDMNTVAGVKLGNLMKSLGMPSCLPIICSTTRSGSQIDCIFSGIQGLEAYISTTLTSHHDPLLVFIPDDKNNFDDADPTLEALMKLRITIDHPASNYTASLTPLVESAHVEQMDTTSPSNFNGYGLHQAKYTSPTTYYGLLNPAGSNICFANASIQALRPVFEKMLNPELSEECIYSELLKLLQNMSQHTHPEDVTPLLSSVRKSDLQLEQELEIPAGTDFTNHKQHDAVEFMDKLLHKLHSDAVMYSSHSDIIADHYRIQLQEIEHSDVCDYQMLTHNPSWYLSIPIIETSSGPSLQDLVQSYFRATTTNLKTCPRCSTRHTLHQRISFQREPETMIIQLGRFLESGEKSNTFIQIPRSFAIDVNNHLYTYNLDSIIHHHGSAGAGHYTAALFHSNGWRVYDDSNVYYTEDSQVLTNTAYVMIYNLTAKQKTPTSS